MKIKKRILFFISILLYRLTMDIVYAKVLSSDLIFGEYSNTYDANILNILLSYLLLIAYTIPLTYISKKRRPSAYIIIVLFLMTYVPWNSLMGCRGIATIYTVMINLYWFFIELFYFIIGMHKFILPKYELRSIKKFFSKNGWLIKIFPFFVLVLILAFAYRYFGGHISLTLRLTASNGLRMAARSYQGGKWMLSRLIPWAATIIFPISFLYYIEKRRILTALFFGLGILVCYSLIGMKQWLFIFAIVIIACIYVKIFKRKNLYYILPIGFTLLNCIVFFVYSIYGNTSIANYTVRRVMYAPCLIGMHHIDFFIDKPKLLLTQCLLGWLRKFGIKMPYSEDIGFKIGQLYYSADTNATAGSIADAFENFGFIGLIIFPMVIVISIKIFDKVAENIKEEFYISILFVYVYSIMSGPLTIAILSYGFLFATIYLWTIKASGNQEYLFRCSD